jgi:hypothetical protein
MAHHHHHDDDSYYTDQLCTVGIAGTFAVVCFALYFWQTQMLKYLLVTESIRFTLLLSGIALFAMAIIRGLTLWNESKTAKAAVHEHVHEHNHEGECCDHDHSHDHAHEHAHEHAHGGAAHSHDHGHHHHDHAHNHGDHSAADHEHSAAPWRYMVMLVPVIFFMLGLPNKGPSAGEFSAKVDADDTALLSVVGGSGEAEPVEFKRLFNSPTDSAERGDFSDRMVKVRGQFTGSPEDARFFQIVRFRGACCAADAQPMPILAVSKEAISGIKRDAWVWVEGQVQYAKRGDSYHLRILVPDASRVTVAQPDPNPYIQ